MFRACFVVLLMALAPALAAAEPPKVGIQPITKDQYKPAIGKVGGRFVDTSLGEPKSFNPITAGETSTTQYTSLMFQGLLKTDPFTGEMAPLIATKWGVAEDGVTWTFHLRKDVKFNDGSPLTARDVVFTWNDLIYDNNRPAEEKDPRWPCSTRDTTTFEGKQLKVTMVDDHTVKVVTPKKLAILPYLFGGTDILPEKKYKPLVENGTFGSSLSVDSKPEDIVGSGPFILGGYERGVKVVLKRNPNYWRKDANGNALPYLNEYVALIIKDMNLMLLKFDRGETDIFGIGTGKHAAHLLPKRNRENFSIYQLGPNPGVTFLGFNMNEDAAKAGKIAPHKVRWFRDQRFRLAVAYALDRDSLIRNVLRRLGYKLDAPFTIHTSPFTTKVETRKRNVAQAKKLLADMGLVDRNGDGVLEDTNGNRVAFTLTTNKGNNLREQTSEFIRKDLADIGMEVNYLPLEFNLLVDKLDVSYDWEAMIMGFTGGIEPHGGANFWYSHARYHLWWPEQKKPSFDWEKRIDEIFNEAVGELDIKKRKALYSEWIKIVYEQQPVVYLTTGERMTALRNKFGNIFPPPSPASGLLHNIDEIFVK